MKVALSVFLSLLFLTVVIAEDKYEKEILEIIERAVDKCQNAATVIEGILIKNM